MSADLLRRIDAEIELLIAPEVQPGVRAIHEARLVPLLRDCRAALLPAPAKQQSSRTVLNPSAAWPFPPGPKL